MEAGTEVVVVRGEEELFARAAHLFAFAEEVSCAASTLRTWASARPRETESEPVAGRRVRKLYRPSTLLERGSAEELRKRQREGAEIRISQDEINETIILDERMAILAGDASQGVRAFSVVTRPEVVRNVLSLFKAAWRRATPLAAYETDFAEVRALAPQILDVLASGCKDETAARQLGLGLRTYRRRVAELMTALGATSRFQAGARAHELGLL